MPDELTSHLGIYLDDNYSRAWPGTNQPDLSKLAWVEMNDSYWYTANLTAYLKNYNDISTDVFADSSPEETILGNQLFPAHSTPGFNVYSENITLNPKQNSPMFIKIEYPKISGVSPNHPIYFHAYQHQLDN